MALFPLDARLKASTPAEPSPRLQPRMDRLADWLEALYSRGAFNGTVLVAERGRICFEKHCGFTDIDGRVPVTGQSSFSLASLSKPFTAFGILLLAHQGKLALHDRIGQHIRELADYDEVTIRQLLHHTSGIPDHIELADEVWDPKVLLTFTDLIAMFRKYRPDSYFAPGDRFEYSNTGYVLLAEIISRTSGLSYPEFMAQKIFTPLGMNDSAAFNLASQDCTLRSRVFGLRKSFGRFVRCDLNFLDGVFGDGGIYSSAEDLVRWDRALREGTLMPREAYDEAYICGKLNDGESTKYGYGWEIESDNVVYHRGEWEGFTSYMRRDLNKHILVVVLSNLAPASQVDPICAELRRFVSGV